MAPVPESGELDNPQRPSHVRRFSNAASHDRRLTRYQTQRPTDMMSPSANPAATEPYLNPTMPLSCCWLTVTRIVNRNIRQMVGGIWHWRTQMLKIILSFCFPLLSLAATQSHADELATRLNGTWQYVAAIESERITSFDDSSAMQLVILNNTWALFSTGTLMQGSVENVEYNQQASPVSFVRRKGKAPHAVGYAILKVSDDHLMYTTTPLDGSRFGSTSGAIGDYVPDRQSERTDLNDPLGQTGLGDSQVHQRPPKSFSPEGTSNTQYILKRINGSTSAMNQITNKPLREHKAGVE